LERGITKYATDEIEKEDLQKSSTREYKYSKRGRKN